MTSTTKVPQVDKISDHTIHDHASSDCFRPLESHLGRPLQLLVAGPSGAGKTALARHLLKKMLGEDPGLYRAETTNSSGESPVELEVAGRHFEQIVVEQGMALRTGMVDVGASEFPTVIEELKRLPGAHAFYDNVILPCAPDSRMVVDAIGWIGRLINVGFRPERITVIKNQVRHVEAMLQDYAPLEAFAHEQRIHIIPEPVMDCEAFRSLNFRPGTLDDVAGDPRDFVAEARLLGKTNPKAARLLMWENVLRMNAISALANVKSVRRQLVARLVHLGDMQ